MDRLMQIGFREIGNWTAEEGRLKLHLQILPPHRRALYAFAVDTKVLYVGKTSGSLVGRLQAYVSPHLTQRTNVRNRAGLLELLGAGQVIKILGWIDPGLHRIGNFDLNIAAGLEDSIISVLAPPWNGARSAEAVKSHFATAGLTDREQGCQGVAPEGEPDVATLDANSASAIAIAPTSLAVGTAVLAQPAPTATTFTVRLGKTYYEHGFFNVPVAFSTMFGVHGTRMDLYCGQERAHLHAILDRKANQQSRTPRIYGKAELANWFQRRFQLGGTLQVTVLSPTSAVLS